jgi:succinoglycan biosynthesis protein ExoM
MASNIDICVATYKRPELLANLLKSLAGQSIRDYFALRVIVVDNDVMGSAETTVSAFRDESGMEIVYDAETTRGISYARNRALRHVTAPLVAFIDDDEEASMRWMESMLAALDRCSADVVFGPVVALLPDGAPAWAKVHPSFHRPRVPTGTIVSHGATNNALLRSEVVRGNWGSGLFNEAFALTGGEDTEFFDRAHRAGFKLIWCDEAVVREHAPMERLTVLWACKRAYRGGQTYFRIFIAKKTALVRLLWLSKRFVALLASIAFLPFLTLGGSGRLVLHLSRMCGWAGQLSQAFGRLFEYEEYGRSMPRA